MEKILSGQEELPADWPVQGTTGYEYLNAVNRLFVHPEGGRAAEQTYFAFLKNKVNYQELLYQKKRLVMSTLLAVEMRYLGRQLGIFAEHDRFARDLPRADLAQALDRSDRELLRLSNLYSGDERAQRRPTVYRSRRGGCSLAQT